MTAKKDLKKLVRDRQLRTGESYTTALQHVLRQRPEEAPPEAEPAERSPVPVVEIADLSEDAARLGLRCRVTIDAALAARIDGSALLARIRDLLIATAGDPATERFQAVVLRGEQPIAPPRSFAALEEGRRFLARARAGLGGVSPSGWAMALNVEGRAGLETVLCVVWHLWRPHVPDREPVLLLATADAIRIEYGEGTLALLVP